MKHKLHSRLLCALLSVLMLVCMIPVITLPSFAEEKKMTVGENTVTYYDSAEETLEHMSLMYTTMLWGRLKAAVDFLVQILYFLILEFAFGSFIVSVSL